MKKALPSFRTGLRLAMHEETGVGLVLEFEEGTLRIHPQREELDGPEIALLAGFEDLALRRSRVSVRSGGANGAMARAVAETSIWVPTAVIIDDADRSR
jgi:hypothetical protein